MTSAVQQQRSDRRGMSGQTLFFLALGLSVLLTVVLSLSVLSSAKRSDIRLEQTVEARLLAILQEDGISGLASALDNSRRVLLPGNDRVETVLYQKRGNTQRLIFETEGGAAQAFGLGGQDIALNNATFRVRNVDVAAASQDWPLPMADVALQFGLAQPTAEMRRAQRMVLTIVLVFLLAAALMIFLQVAHWQRYRRSLQSINLLLDRYSKGETGIRFEETIPAPELRELGQHLNVVLPKIDGLFADLRAMSAHLAHELRTPLQTIRSGIRKIVREEDTGQRKQLARAVDAGIDTADARLQTVMQLFRLQADADVDMAPHIALGDILINLIYDFEDDLLRHDRTLTHEVDENLSVFGNAHLLELMLSNLLSNTAKYTPAGGSIHIEANTQNDRLFIRVRNSGQMSKDLSAGAFNRFAQGEGHQGVTGYGLGLSLVHSIAIKHGFSVELVQENASNGDSFVCAVIEGSSDA